MRIHVGFLLNDGLNIRRLFFLWLVPAAHTYRHLRETACVGFKLPEKSCRLGWRTPLPLVAPGSPTRMQGLRDVMAMYREGLLDAEEFKEAKRALLGL